MYEMAMSALGEFCDLYYKTFLETANKYPNDPLLIDDGKSGISAKDHTALRVGMMKFISKKCPSLGYHTWIPKALHKKVKKAFPRNQKGDYIAEWIGVNYLGLCINGNNFWLLSTSIKGHRMHRGTKRTIRDR